MSAPQHSGRQRDKGGPRSRAASRPRNGDRRPAAVKRGIDSAPGRARHHAGRERQPAGLTRKQARFVEEYVVDLNATQAAIRSGHSERTAASIGSENLRKPEIAAAIERALEARSARTGITQDRVLRELEALAFSSVDHYRVSTSGEVSLAPGAPGHAMQAVQSIKRKVSTRGTGARTETVREVEIRLWDKPGPLKLAGQHVGLFTERIEHTGKILLEDAVMASREPGGQGE